MTKEGVFQTTRKIIEPGTDEVARRVRAYIDWNVGDPQEVEDDIAQLSDELDFRDKGNILIAARNAARGEGMSQFQTEVAEYLESREDYEDLSGNHEHQ